MLMITLSTPDDCSSPKIVEIHYKATHFTDLRLQDNNYIFYVNSIQHMILRKGNNIYKSNYLGELKGINQVIIPAHRLESVVRYDDEYYHEEIEKEYLEESNNI